MAVQASRVRHDLSSDGGTFFLPARSGDVRQSAELLEGRLLDCSSARTRSAISVRNSWFTRARTEVRCQRGVPAAPWLLRVDSSLPCLSVMSLVTLANPCKLPLAFRKAWQRRWPQKTRAILAGFSIPPSSLCPRSVAIARICSGFHSSRPLEDKTQRNASPGFLGTVAFKRSAPLFQLTTWPRDPSGKWRIPAHPGSANGSVPSLFAQGLFGTIAIVTFSKATPKNCREGKKAGRNRYPGECARHCRKSLPGFSTCGLKCVEALHWKRGFQEPWEFRQCPATKAFRRVIAVRRAAAGLRS